MTWVRFKEAQPSSRPYHVIREVEAGSVLTACEGRCSQTDLAEIHDAPDEDSRCLGCRAAIGEQVDEAWDSLVAAIREAERSGVA